MRNLFGGFGVICLLLAAAIAFRLVTRTQSLSTTKESAHTTQLVSPQSLPRPDTLFPRDDSDAILHSVWVENERRRFTSLLKSHECDILVVPVQSEHLGFDRATRSLMSAQVAQLLSANSDRCVTDPYMVNRALGEGLRRVSENAVHELAGSIHAKTIVWIYAGHDGRQQMEVYLRTEVPYLVSGANYKVSGQKDWEPIQFSDENPPFVAWEDKLPEILSDLGLTASRTHKKNDETAQFKIPDSPEQLAELPSKDALDDARRYELLGTLAPQPEYRGTERLFEKSWLAADNSGDSVQGRRLRARALFHLDYRPAALALIAKDDSAEARVLRALLNGNLIEATSLQVELQTPLEQVIAALEIHDLQLAYRPAQQKSQESLPLQKLSAQSEAWEALLSGRSDDFDKWKVGDNVAIKSLLDVHYPIEGFKVRDILMASQTLGRMPSSSDLMLLATQHVNRLLEQQNNKFCCASFSVSPTAIDFLDLLGSRTQANLEKAVANILEVRGSPDDAINLLNAFDAEFSGHPHFSALRASAEVELAINHNDERHTERLKLSADAARSAAYWEQGMTRYTQNALIDMGVPSLASTPFIGAYGSDFPPRPYWRIGGNNATHALLYSTNNLEPIDALIYKANDETRRMLLSELKQRFQGAPDVANLRTRLSGTSGNQDTQELRDEIAKDPTNWQLYSSLENQLILASDYKGARELVLQYPGFQQGSNENTVELSNHLNEVARQLYWKGAISEATDLYKFSGRYQNGSEASMIAAERLSFMEGNYPSAAQAALERLSRYDTPQAYRDYLSLLFALGYSRQAWPAFLKIADRFSDQEVWHAALVGQRVDGATAQNVIDWASGDSIRSLRIGVDIPAIRFALTSFMVDRMPPQNLVEILTRIEGPPETIADMDPMSVRRALPGGQMFSTIARSKFHEAERKPLQDEERVASAYVLFAEAYGAVRHGENARAVSAFARLANYYRIEGPEMDVALPYFAFSAAKTGDALGLRTFLNELPEQNKQFAFYLAQAYFAGLNKMNDESIEQLRNAFARMPASGPTVQMSAYQFAEECIWLFEETADSRYRDLALDYARKYQKIDPTMAWAYSLEAKYGDVKDKGHIRAVAIALYLDRSSQWLSKVANPDITKAQAWLKQNNPFKTKAAVGAPI